MEISASVHSDLATYANPEKPKAHWNEVENHIQPTGHLPGLQRKLPKYSRRAFNDCRKTQNTNRLKHTQVVSSSLCKEKAEVMNAAHMEPMRRLNSITLITMKSENRTIWPSKIAHQDVAFLVPGRCRNDKFPS